MSLNQVCYVAVQKVLSVWLIYSWYEAFDVTQRDLIINRGHLDAYDAEIMRSQYSTLKSEVFAYS